MRTAERSARGRAIAEEALRMIDEGRPKMEVYAELGEHNGIGSKTVLYHVQRLRREQADGVIDGDAATMLARLAELRAEEAHILRWFERRHAVVAEVDAAVATWRRSP